jgi:uncharacterized protein (TIGR02284 family)
MRTESTYRTDLEAMDDSDVVDVVNDLIETSKDGEYGFRTCAEHSRRPELQVLFSRRASECRQAAEELANLVVEFGGEPETSGSVSGAIQRGWLAMRGSVALADDLSMLEACERGEDAALARYQDALKKNLPLAVMGVVSRQCEGVQRNHDLIRDRRNLMRATEA